ncbi:MAG TPA: DegT/DnrJ/EryC1/StrS family aminotransferase [Chthoniobacterales bacterium]|nr:DegT/DnrJ/EryC1/StrS family aminotransferase [Chthoniobacterales bacterium]
MRVPLLDLSQQYRSLADPLRAEIEQVLESQRFILGPKLNEFEQAITEFCLAPFAIGVSSGTDALLAILMGMEIGHGDAVITTPFTFFATAGCVARLGAKPIFVDIDQATLNISPAALEKFVNEECEKRDQWLVIRSTGEKVRAIIPVHLFGLCCEMNEIHRIAQSFSLTIIEDAAQAIGAEYPFLDGPRAAGTMGSTGFFSFYPTKNLGAAGDAGLILCRDHNVAEKLRTIREHGMRPRYYHALLGGNFRMDEIQAAILKVKLPHLRKWAAARRAAADFYGEQFAEAGLTGTIRLPAEPYRQGVTEHHVYHQYVIRTPDRDGLREHLARNEIGSEIYYPLGLHLQECFRGLGYRDGDLPQTERATHEVLALPMFPEISRESQRYVVETIKRFFAP